MSIYEKNPYSNKYYLLTSAFFYFVIHSYVIYICNRMTETTFKMYTNLTLGQREKDIHH